MKSSRLALALCATAAIAACGKKDAQSDQGGGAPGAGGNTAAATTGDDQDPCRLVTQAEAEKWLGPLAHAPYRADNGGNPAAAGKLCKFLGSDGRYITMEVEWTDGKMEMTALSMMGSLVGQVFTDDNGKTDTLEGSWDKARWMGPGQFYALKDEVLVTTNVGAAKGGIAAAADLSSKALERVDKLLAYNGAAAVAGAPKQRETGDACALITAGEFAANAMSVDGAPVPSGKGSNTMCLYHLNANGGPTELQIDVTWRKGFEHFAGDKQVMAAVLGGIGMPKIAHGQTGETTKAGGVKTPSVAKDPDMQKMLGMLKGLAKTQGIHLDDNGGLMHDTVITGPWAEGAILGGVSFVAVKNDVAVTMGFKTLTIEQVKALMAKVMEKL
jgi:hypothetical protein